MFVSLVAVFPILGPVFDYFDIGVFDTSATKFFSDVTKDACKLRKEEGKSAPKVITCKTMQTIIRMGDFGTLGGSRLTR